MPDEDDDFEARPAIVGEPAAAEISAPQEIVRENIQELIADEPKDLILAVGNTPVPVYLLADRDLAQLEPAAVPPPGALRRRPGRAGAA